MKWTDRYDRDIKASAGAFLAQFWGLDARLWWKAELCAESRLDPDAQSPAGAQGIAQIMPATWRDIVGRLGGFPPGATPFQPEHAIRGGAWYLSRLVLQWKSPRSDVDRRRLAQATYNAGLRNLLDAQKLAGGAADYGSIIAQLPAVTGEKNAAETRSYVERIERIYNELRGPRAPN
jgi:membrane-bound lytic murein transglycosylase F